MTPENIINYSKTQNIYVAYRKARAEMKELLTVKANVEQILGKTEKRT